MKLRIWCLIFAVLLAGCAALPEDTTGPTLPVFQWEPTTVPSVPTFPPVESTPPPTEPATVPTVPPTQPPQKLIVIDAGHQQKANYGKEPVGPGATELKSKVSSGTQGVVTGLPEYVLNLLVAEKLRDILESRGYEVVMVRTAHDVDLSNAQRAQVANDLGADAFIRIHANGSDNPDTAGILTICQTPNNPYNSDLYSQSRKLSGLVLDAMAAATGAKGLYVWETDTMSGINWCAVPVTIVEMGFLSNPREDQLLSTEAYQQKIATGIADGIDAYFEE